MLKVHYSGSHFIDPSFAQGPKILILVLKNFVFETFWFLELLDFLTKGSGTGLDKNHSTQAKRLGIKVSNFTNFLLMQELRIRVSGLQYVSKKIKRLLA